MGQPGKRGERGDKVQEVTQLLQGLCSSQGPQLSRLTEAYEGPSGTDQAPVQIHHPHCGLWETSGCGLVSHINVGRGFHRD